MRLYHRTNLIAFPALVLILQSVVLWGCAPAQTSQALVSVSIKADQKEYAVKIASGSTVQETIKSAQLIVGDLDKATPALTDLVADGMTIVVTRIKEEFYSEQVVIPFEHQELRNEALPEGERRLSQSGVNGLEETTYRRLFEDGVLVSTDVVKTTVVKKAVPEIEMIGSRSMFTAIPIPGKIAYLSAGNAWIIENNTGDRKLVVSTGDLDGRVFSLSPDGRYLLFTRFSTSEHTINSLWVAMLDSDPITMIDLDVANIIHFAGFDPASERVAYSTAEWREAAPGWRANNDLFELDLSSNGIVSIPRRDMEPDSGGVYGWWGTDYVWSPDGLQFLYSRPDGIGIIDHQNNFRKSILNFTSYQAEGDWAWVPGVAWSPAGDVVYTVCQPISDTAGSNTSRPFNLLAIPLKGGTPVALVNDVGMFAYPVASPIAQVNNLVNPDTGETVRQGEFDVAYLQATDPRQSETSAYRLFIVDRDGSNQKALFPEADTAGVAPQHVAWSPTSLGEEGNFAIALVYNGNIWIIDANIGTALQVTGDGLTTRVDWR